MTKAEFMAGAGGNITGLEQDTPYKLVAISYNTTTTSPDVNSGTTTITVDPSIDLLHWVGDVTIASGSPSPTVEITFKHRFPKLMVSIDTSLTGENITGLTSATLTPGYMGVLTLLIDDVPDEGASILTQTFTTWTAFGAQSVSSYSRYVFTGDDNPLTVAFSGLTLHGTQYNPTSKFNSALLSGHSYTLTARVAASRGNYYAGKTGSNYEVTIPLGSGGAYSYTDKNGVDKTVGELTFLRYNLGADPDLDPKQQMAYSHTDDKNIRVYGGFFQWGRKDVYHILRDEKTDATSSSFTTTQYTLATYDPDSSDQQFVWAQSSPWWWLSDDAPYSNLWGNGGSLGNQTNFQYNSATPLSPAHSYNPCPTGYRVPTQHEWALILNEAGNSSENVGDYFRLEDGGTNTAYYGTTWYVPANNQNLVWVRVSDGKPSIAWPSSNNNMNGFAFYSLSSLNISVSNISELNTTFAVTVNLTAEDAPEPLMFLPAAGYRQSVNTELYLPGERIYYWSSTVVVGAMYTSSTLGSHYNYVFADNSSTRASGLSIRCIKEL
ncbi:MAG: hypothetical protein LBS46_02885 [Dysgonamonadaceae bacterium]|nr:hypothetical protein [Dysgonamonadaceae bacterium]